MTTPAKKALVRRFMKGEIGSEHPGVEKAVRESMKKKAGKVTDKEAEAREFGRHEGAAWAVAQVVHMEGTSTLAMELARAWGMKNLLRAVDETDLPHLKKLIKDWPKQFGCYRSERKEKKL